VTKGKKKTSSLHGTFARIPVVIAKEALGILSAPEFRVWFALCSQNQHWANGTGKLCRSVIREFHLGSQRVVTAATKTLLERNYIVRTRSARQRVCALYGVTHEALNTDAMAKAGFSEPEIRAVLTRFAAIVSATNRGSANSATNAEALNDKNDIRGSAKPLKGPLALPTGKRISPFLDGLALHRRNTSKRSPCPDPIPGSSSGSGPDSDIPSTSAGGRT
jgi:DNA-binding MarR family transcriptional regulator